MDKSSWSIWRGSYNVNKQITFKSSMPRSDLCDYSDSCIVVKETITVLGNNNIDKKNRYFST